MQRRKYLYFGLLAMFLLNLADIATTFWNDSTLKSEVNPLFLKYKLNAAELILLLFAYQLAYSALFAYHAIVFKGYDISSTAKNISNFLKRMMGIDKYNKQPLRKTINNIIQSVLNLVGIYALWDYCIGKLIISIHNSLLALLANNSSHTSNAQTKKVDIYLNDSKLWETFLGNWVKSYNSYTLAHPNDIFLIHYKIECVLVTVVFLIYIANYYKTYRKA